MNIIVVPTIRKECITKFIHEWKNVKGWDAIIVVEDNPEKTFDLQGVEHYSWNEIDADLQENNWIISRRDSAIKCYGFLQAHRMGAKYIFALDDDCYPLDPNFIQKHIDVLEKTSRWTESVLGQRTRGIPYYNKSVLNNVVLNVGLWTGIPDLDAPQSLVGGLTDDYIPPLGNRILPTEQYFPICGMNLAFKREVCPLTYFPLMGQSSPYGRFDDIWFGIIFKRICDHLKLRVACGEPFVHHQRASNIMTNLVKEAPGIQFNETFWEIIDTIPLTSHTPKTCMIEMGKVLKSHPNSYLSQLGQAMVVWANLFQTIE